MKQSYIVPTAISGAAAFLLGRYYLQTSSLLKLLLGVLVAAYVPHYFDKSEFTAGERYSAGGSGLIRPHALKWLRYIGLRPRLRLNDIEAFKKHKQVIFASHPHGVMSFHHGLLYLHVDGAEELNAIIPLQRRRALAARSLFLVPFLRDLILMFGAVDASAAVASDCLSEGYSLTVLPGGEHEQLLAKKDHHGVYIKNRKGFCRLAVKHNVPVVPAYCFGETATYNTSSFLITWRKWLAKRFFIAVPLAWGPNWFNFLIPEKTDLVHCVGEPIPIPPPDHSLEEKDDFTRRVDLVHEAYIQSLKKIFDENKDSCGFPEAELQIL